MMAHSKLLLRRGFVAWLTYCGSVLVSAAVLSGQASVLTWHNDNARTGQNLQETILTPANVNSSTFGQLAVLNVDGKVDAQPLYVPSVSIPNQGVHNVLYVATEHGSLYAFDADTFVQLRQVSLLGANEVPSDDHGCGQVTPEIGITATPAIDLQVGRNGTIYSIAQSKDATQHYHHRLHALDLTTLTEQPGSPVEIQASYTGSGAENTFNPAVHTERPGLLISNGVVYTSWGSHCDGGAYEGWVLSYNATTLAQVGVLGLIPNGNDGGVWAAGSGPAADANGNVYLLTGNGTFDTALNSAGFPSLGDYGNAFVKISTSGPLAVTDYFTMLNTVAESAADVDLGSGGLMLLPPMDNGKGTGTLVSLVVGAGKDSNIYVLDQGNLGKFNPGMDSIYQLMSGVLPAGTWSSPAWFNGTLYYGGVADNLKAFAFTNGLFAEASQSAHTFPYPGTTPSISVNGTANGIVWAVENQATSVLHAYDANNLANELYNSNQAGGRDHFGAGNKFIVPTIANGKVYVGTTSGVGVFGRLAGSPAPLLSIAKTHTGNFTQGQAGATYTVTVSNALAAGPTIGQVTTTETAPAGLTLVSMVGTGWSCPTGGSTCTRSDALNPGASYPVITVTVNVASDAGVVLSNSAAVSGGGSAGSSISDSTMVAASPVLSVTAVVAGNFIQGQTGAAYSVTVSNRAGTGTSSGLVTVTETVPAGMTLVSMAGTGWTCPAGGTACTRSDALSGGASYPAIRVTVNVAANATSPQVNAVSVSGGGSAGANTTLATTITTPGPALRFVPVTLCRVADTRNPAGPFGGPALTGGSSRDFNIPAGACGVPSTALAYSANLGVAPHGALGFVTLWPAGEARPLASTLNSVDGRTKSSAAIVPAGAAGAISVFARNTTDVVLDINGYFVSATDPTALAFYPITPCRVADTRKAALGLLGTPSMGAGQSRTFPILSSACNIPATAQAYSLNFTAVPGGPLGYLTTWPTGQAKPQASSLNAITGTVTANAAIVPAGTIGSIDVFASNATDVVIDINGYFAPMVTGGLSLYGVTPCRVVDTRKPPGSPAVTSPDVGVSASACGIPANAQAHVLSVTVVPPTPLGYLTLWPQGQARPTVSTLNALDGAITSNMAIVPTTNGSISAFASNLTHLILDISAYFGQ